MVFTNDSAMPLDCGLRTDHTLTPRTVAGRVVSYPVLWQELTFAVVLLYSLTTCVTVAGVCCIISLRQKALRIPANMLLAIAAGLALMSRIVPSMCGRTGPQMTVGSFPDMYVASAVAFYGTAVVLATRYGKMAIRRVAMLLTALGVVLCGFSGIFFGYSWMSDVAGGLLLGFVLTSTARLYLRWSDA